MKAAVFCLLLLAGCVQVPDGVKMSDEEAIACRSDGCTVWTEEELKQVIREVFSKGYEAGKRSI